MGAPPLLLERPPAMQIVLAVVVPLVFGVICGLLIGVNAAVYTVVSLLAILGGIAAGYEHPTGDEGAVRGFCGGMLFGMGIIVTVALTNVDPKAKLPDPHAFLVVVTTILGMIFGAIGGVLRRRHDRRVSAEARTA